MKRPKILMIVLMAFLFVLTITYPVLAADTIKIGVIGPMNFVQGKHHWNGALMARDEINAAGGVQVGDKKMKIELVKADSNEFLSMTDATNAMELLLTREKVDFVVGGFRTEAVLAMQDIAMDYKTIFLGCGAATKKICDRVGEDYDRYKYWFRITPFNNIYLAKTNFIHLATVAGIMRKTVGIQKPRVAIVGEKQAWVEAMVKASEATIPKLGMEVAGVWRPSQTATDVTAELSAIQRADAHIVFTIFSATVGVTFAKQIGELKIPVAQVGINVEAQKDAFIEATGGMGNYVMTLNTYTRGVEINELTQPFVEAYIKRFGETPAYNAGTHDAINILAASIKKAGSLDSDKVVAEIEKWDANIPAGHLKFNKDHDPIWGPGYLTGVGVQWQDGKMVPVWPNKWKPTPESPEITYKGVVPYKLPPWFIEKYKK
ncbi:MAG: ABC transporter substrate-binding protein [Desulfobacterales bacterium]|jgi:branched-chain amino acid transport system substrate-binding protein